MEYTKGEWEASGFYVSVNNRPIIEMVIGGKEGNAIPCLPITELQANLELCAAAPEMYKVCQILMLVDEKHNPTLNLAEAIRFAKQALAKAEGKNG